MHKTINNLISIQNELKSSSEKDIHPKIIAVSKTFPLDSIQPLIDHGHCHIELLFQQATTLVKSNYDDPLLMRISLAGPGKTLI